MENKEDKRLKFIELRGKGNSFDRIAKELNVSKATLINWSNELKQEVGNYVAMERDAILERYKMTKKHQMELYGEQLTSIREELSKRKLDDIPTEKLLNMELRILDELKSVDRRIILTATEEDVPFSFEKEVQWEA